MDKQLRVERVAASGVGTFTDRKRSVPRDRLRDPQNVLSIVILPLAGRHSFGARKSGCLEFVLGTHTFMYM